MAILGKNLIKFINSYVDYVKTEQIQQVNHVNMNWKNSSKQL